MKTIALRLASKIEWESYDALDGSASHVGIAVRALLEANDVAAAESAYWELENRIVVQGTVYSAAVPVTSVLIASLLDETPMPVRISILDLFFHIITGVSADPARDFVKDCSAHMTEGTWLIVREFVFGPRDAARDVLDRLNVNIDYDLLV